MRRQVRINNDEMRSLRKNSLSIIKIGHMLVCYRASRGKGRIMAEHSPVLHYYTSITGRPVEEKRRVSK
ncbi:uncharacterized protein BJ212DRAFT_1359171 [Suillus subaureus]|uniref:Uncharacterized protein n=1 Tax=Suillus subaureus TaxID=48587 RepID=A0A9P7E9H2_9AGAM|nr:uncharacterized protein BJ212DRAFT_1359171 [Suillus subaureus]KAG1815057.1 hypothetical protein BJ212DRAFT_1359171 [Suillus subaureus]